ncbi:uncharacterized protein N7483_002245 [Penicillium malachiteum]|uniref:uncharacterized protein n=1 Tax=Penicillium malachiteum TaxID=1324776 RepID=UPI002548913E|nr:uncharacterized protein N7483_002245 [Penicillium malachiteum]KAJ5737120.1 hypothetical protein N7483_002245 [Penicillium malachiteum]
MTAEADEFVPADAHPSEKDLINFSPSHPESLTRMLICKCHTGSRLFKHGFTVPWNIKSRKKQHSKGSVAGFEFITLPDASGDCPQRKREAIVIDCEMVEVTDGRREVAFMTALDFLTGEILINHYVQPRSRVINWNSRYSGVVPSAMRAAVSSGYALTWDGARDLLCKYGDTETVLIGHALNNDLDVLGIVHLNIVDSSILTCDAVFPDLPSDKAQPRSWGLKTLTKEFLGYDIQNSKNGHSAMEDAYATREVVTWCITQPDRLNEWATWHRKIEDERQAEREKKREEDRKKKAAEAKKKAEEAKNKAEENGEDTNWYASTYSLSLCSSIRTRLIMDIMVK